jgi:hypothetical protein
MNEVSPVPGAMFIICCALIAIACIGIAWEWWKDRRKRQQALRDERIDKLIRRGMRELKRQGEL